MDNLEIFTGYHNKYKGTLVLDYWDVCLFRGMILDQEDDYYYDLLRYRDEKSIWVTGVGKIIFLIDVLPKKDYEHLVDVWNLNKEEKAI